MKPDRIFETVIYADDLDAAKIFYGDVLQMDLLGSSELFLVFRLPSSVLLIFNPEISREEDRQVPSHGASGEGHLAFSATDEEIDKWKNQLEDHGVEIEQVVNWDQGGRSLYVRDPAGNSVEFAPSTLWGGQWDF